VQAPASFASASTVSQARNGQKIAPPAYPVESHQTMNFETPVSSPPPPPNFEEQDVKYMPPAAAGKRLEKPIGRADPIEMKGVPGKTIDIEIQADPDWRSACRDVVRLVSEYEGQDGLRIRIAGQPMYMEFPNQRTRLCSELVTKIEQLPAVIRVEVVEIPGNRPNPSP
jgi:hypothetical protein